MLHLVNRQKQLSRGVFKKVTPKISRKACLMEFTFRKAVTLNIFCPHKNGEYSAHFTSIQNFLANIFHHTSKHFLRAWDLKNLSFFRHVFFFRKNLPGHRFETQIHIQTQIRRNTILTLATKHLMIINKDLQKHLHLKTF